jgi:cell division protein FtsZ
VIWGARIRNEFEGKVRVMAIMTGVRSAQVLGPYQSHGQTVTTAKPTATPATHAPTARQVAPAADRKSGGLIDFL